MLANSKVWRTFCVVNNLRFLNDVIMEKKTTVLVLFVCLFFVCACSVKSDREYDCPIVKVDLSTPQKSLVLTDIIESVELIKLELPDSLFFGIVSSVQCVDSTIFVTDKKQKCIFRFNKKGIFLNTIGARGEAPGEYRDITIFFVGNRYVYICDMGMREILCYTHQGKYVKSIAFGFDIVFDDITAISDSKFLCHQIQGEKGEPKIWILNDKGKIEKILLAHEDIYPYSYTDWCTINCTLKGEKWEINDPCSGVLYEYNAYTDTLREELCLVTDKKSLSDYEGKRQISKIGEYSYYSVLVATKKYMYTIWHTSEKRPLFSILDKRGKDVRVGRMPEMKFSDYLLYPLSVSTNLPNTLITVLTDECPDEYLPIKYRTADFDRVAILQIAIFK